MIKLNDTVVIKLHGNYICMRKRVFEGSKGTINWIDKKDKYVNVQFDKLNSEVFPFHCVEVVE